MSYTLLLVSSILFSTTFQQKLIKVKVNDYITMQMPDDFRPMTDDEIADRYFTIKKPMALFTNYESVVDLGVNKSVTQWRERDLKIMMDFQKSNIFSIYDKVDIIKEGVKEVNGRNFAYMEFSSSVNEEKDAIIKKGAIKKYTYIQYTILNGHSLVFNFTCPARLKNQWQPSVEKIMNNISVKKSFK